MTPRHGRLALGALAVLFILAGGARADDFSGYLELTALDFDSRDETFGVTSVDQSTQALNKRLYLAFNRRLFPRLTVWGGGTFDDVDGTTRSAEEEFRSDFRRIRPYLGARRQTPTQYQQILWSRDEQETRVANGVDLRLIRDAWNGAVGWKRPDLPSVRAWFYYNHDRDADRRVRDERSSGVELNVQHEFRAPVKLTYRGALAETDDRLTGTSTRAESHTGSVRYDDDWLDGRIGLNVEYTAATRDNETRLEGDGEVVLPVYPRAGLASVPRDETPLDGELVEDGQLIDEERAVATAAGIDLGLPQAGESDLPWAIGLLVEPGSAVNTLYVWVTVQNDLLEATWATLVWRVFTSANGRDWMPRSEVSGAPFDSFLKRFEVRFPEVTTEWIKVVVEPLRPDAPFASDHADILVTEIDAAISGVQDPRTIARTETSQTGNVSTRMRLLADREFYYEGYFRYADSDRRPETWNVSNGLSYRQPLGTIYDLSARVTHEIERRAQQEERGVLYAATLSASPGPRLHYTLSLSGREDEVSDPLSSDTISLFLYAIAALYEGIDLNVGIGQSWEDPVLGGRGTSTQVTASARIVPTPVLSFGLSYLDTAAERFATGTILASDTFTKATEVNATFTPRPTLYFYGSWRLEWLDEEPRQTITNWVANWAPFPGGMVRIGINYYETRRTELDAIQRVFGPSVRWIINPRSWAQIAWQRVRETSTVRLYDNDIVNGTLRWGF